MRKHLGTVLAVAGLIAAPAIAQAQARGGMAMGNMPKHEFGVDLSAYLNSPSGGTSGLVIGLPACTGTLTPCGPSVRVGFVSSGNMQWEGRLSFGLSTAGTTTYAIDPGVNVLFKIGRGTLMNNKYFTVGADANLVGSTPSGVIPGINAGIGMRKPYGGAAWRLEAFGRYQFKNTSLGVPNVFQVGAKVGLSLWH